MINTKKIIACLYAGIVAACAMEDTKELIFDGDANQNGLINFDVQDEGDKVKIKKVSINPQKLVELRTYHQQHRKIYR